MNLPCMAVKRPLRVTNALAAVAGLFALLVTFSLAFAAAPAGSLIRNQASATYINGNGIEQFATSNTVETIVRQAAALELAQSQNKLASSGDIVIFPHAVVNTGNGPDSFSLSTTQGATDNFEYLGITLFADNNQDGVADNSTPITTSPVLAAGDSFAFVVVANVPSGLAVGLQGDLDVEATSAFDTSVTTTNSNSSTITAGALMVVSKSMNITQGDSPSGPYTITLSYQNNGASTATDVTLIDALPTGMSYVPNSARWSLDESTVLTDANPADAQGISPNTVRFCAYDTSCNGLAESIRDTDTISSNQVTAVLSNVTAGGRGALTFNVTIDSGMDAGDLLNAAEFEYTDNGTPVARVETNVVAFRISTATGVVANGSITSNVDGASEPVNLVSAFQGSTVDFDNIIWNTGNDTDIIDIVIDQASSTFPEGTVLRLLRGDSATPLLDTNGNGIPDTGPLDPGASFKVVLRAILAPDALGDNGGAGFQVTKKATSTNDPSASNTVTDSLDLIVPSAIDLTNQAATGEPGALGEGAGPETDAVVTLSAQPGETIRFSLFVANIGNTPDQLALTASTDSTFATTTLPEGWSVVFRNADDTETITNTEQLIASDAEQIFADVTVPPNQADVVQDLYFRALSPVTGSGDIIHDAVEVVGAPSLLLEPTGAAQVEAGGATVYAHRLENSSNDALGPVDLSVTDTLSSSGWTSKLYEDTDDDGVFTAADQIIDSIATLQAGDVRILFVRVASPANAASGATNTTTLSASVTSSAISVSVQDVTTIAAGDIAITKEQAPDVGCDGTLDGPYSAQPFSLEPGNNCVRYKLTATNAGVEPVFNAIIEDATPPFTVYEPAAVCSAIACIIVEPAAGGTGRVSGEVAVVAPGASVELTFAVVIE